MQNIARWSDGIRSVEHFFSRSLSRRHQSPSHRLVTHDVSVSAGRQFRRFNTIRMPDPFDGLAKGPTRSKRFLVGLSNDRLTITKFPMNKPKCRIHVATVQPIDESHGKEILASICFLHAKPKLSYGLFRQTRHRHLDKTIVLHRRLFERARLQFRKLQIFVFETIFVDD